MTVRLKEASAEDTAPIVGLLMDMQAELQEFEFDKTKAGKSVQASFNEGVHWFLFVDDAGTVFGACHLQSVYNYWREEKRFYLGGFYIAPSFRGQGHFRKIYGQLKAWAAAHNGVQIYAHIHKDNAKSLKTFASAGLGQTGYLLYVDHWGD